MDDAEIKRLKQEISDLLEEKLKNVKEEVVDEISEKIDSQEVDPYESLRNFIQQAINEVKKEYARAIQEGDTKEIETIKEKQQKLEKFSLEIEDIIEQIEGEVESSIPFDNPIYPKKWYYHLFPALYHRKSHKRSSRNWLALLLAGVGLGLIFTGIGEAAVAMQSTQGSLILGAIILILLAWLEKRKVFSLLGQE